MKELDLGKERIPKLIKKFAIPCVISMQHYIILWIKYL